MTVSPPGGSVSTPRIYTCRGPSGTGIVAPSGVSVHSLMSIRVRGLTVGVTLGV